MRKEERMKPVLDAFAEIQEVRGLTVAQIFTALQKDAGWDLFYMEDEELCEYAKRFFCVNGEKEYEWMPILHTLDKAWHLVPDWRLAQLLCNVMTKDFKTVSDEDLGVLLRAYFRISD